MELADLKVTDLWPVVLKVAVVDVAEIGEADVSLGEIKGADLSLVVMRGAGTLVTTALMVLLNITWLSSLRLE